MSETNFMDLNVVCYVRWVVFEKINSKFDIF